MQNFFTSPENFTDTVVRLVGDDYHHATRSCRVRIGEMIGVTDGMGKRIHARIESIDNRCLTASIERDVSGIGEPDVEITLALAAIKASRFEFALEKCTELGVRHFIPLITSRCEPNSSKRLKQDRLERIILEASKQSGRSWIPGITESVSLDSFMKQVKEPVLTASQRAEINLHDAWLNAADTGRVTILIGPEGDFTGEEYTLMADSGAILFSMGELTLRSETAAVTAAALVIHRGRDYPADA